MRDAKYHLRRSIEGYSERVMTSGMSNYIDEIVAGLRNFASPAPAVTGASNESNRFRFEKIWRLNNPELSSIVTFTTSGKLNRHCLAPSNTNHIAIV